MKMNDLKSVLNKVGGKSPANVNTKINTSDAKLSEFKNILQRKVENEVEKSEVKLSSHARKRLEERNLGFDGQEFLKLKDAIGKLKEKGGHDSLVVTDKAAYIVDVDKQTVVTAIDKNDMSQNVFTKIDSTYFIN